jgi:hypothetical protein
LPELLHICRICGDAKNSHERKLRNDTLAKLHPADLKFLNRESDIEIRVGGGTSGPKALA